MGSVTAAVYDGRDVRPAGTFDPERLRSAPVGGDAHGHPGDARSARPAAAGALLFRRSSGTGPAVDPDRREAQALGRSTTAWPGHRPAGVARGQPARGSLVRGLVRAGLGSAARPGNLAR